MANAKSFDCATGQEVLVTIPDVAAIIPNQVTMRQARLALYAAGLLANVDAAIAGMSDPAKTKAQIEWTYASDVRRDSPLIQTLGAALGLSSGQIDQLFLTAATL